MWELDHKEGWVPKNWCFWTVVLEKTLESPLDCKEIQPVHPKGNQSWIFIGRTVSEAPVLWPPDAESWLTGKDPDAGKDWRQEEKGVTEDEMVGWHHQLNGHEFAQTHIWNQLQRVMKDKEAWRAAAHGVSKNRHDWLNNDSALKGYSAYSKLTNLNISLTPNTLTEASRITFDHISGHCGSAHLTHKSSSYGAFSVLC